MSDRLRLTLLSALPLLAPACGDSGSDTAGATMVTTATASAGDTNTDSDGGATQPPDNPTTGAVAGSTTTAADTTGTTGAHADTTGAHADTTGAHGSTTNDDTTGGAHGTTTSDDTTSGGGTCGDGVVDPGETCDDGATLDCGTTHDGGDGTCVPAGTCSAGYVLAEGTCVAEVVTAHVHIMVSNTCEMTVDPGEFSVSPGQKLKLEYHNHSVDYPVDVWMHYNGGFTDLPPGDTWKEPYEHCFGPVPSEGYADIQTACSDYHLPIHCL